MLIHAIWYRSSLSANLFCVKKCGTLKGLYLKILAMNLFFIPYRSRMTQSDINTMSVWTLTHLISEKIFSFSAVESQFLNVKFNIKKRILKIESLFESQLLPEWMIQEREGWEEAKCLLWPSGKDHKGLRFYPFASWPATGPCVLA